MKNNKLIITKLKYGYELRTRDHRFFFLERNGFRKFIVNLWQLIALTR